MKPQDISFKDWEAAYRKDMGELDNQPPPGYLSRREISKILRIDNKQELWQRRRLEKMVEEGWLLKVTCSRTHYYKPIFPKEDIKRGFKKFSAGKDGNNGVHRNR